MTRRERQAANRARRYATPECHKQAVRLRRLLRGRYRDRPASERARIVRSLNPLSNPYAFEPPPHTNPKETR